MYRSCPFTSNSHSIHRNAMTLMLLLPTFYRSWNWGIKKLNNFLKLAQLMMIESIFIARHSDPRDTTLGHYTTIYQVKYCVPKSFRKTSTSALLTMPKPLTVWITANCGKFWKRWEYQTAWPASWEICMQVKKKQLELDMEQQAGSNQERSTTRLYIVMLLL